MSGAPSSAASPTRHPPPPYVWPPAGAGQPAACKSLPASRVGSRAIATTSSPNDGGLPVTLAATMRLNRRRKVSVPLTLGVSLAKRRVALRCWCVFGPPPRHQEAGPPSGQCRMTQPSAPEGCYRSHRRQQCRSVRCRRRLTNPGVFQSAQSRADCRRRFCVSRADRQAEASSVRFDCLRDTPRLF